MTASRGPAPSGKHCSPLEAHAPEHAEVCDLQRSAPCKATVSVSAIGHCGSHPPRRNSGLCHVCTGGNSTKRRKKMGSSVAYKTIGTFLSQDKRHEDACGWATEMRNSGCAAVRHRPTLCFTHRTCKFDLFLSS